MVVVLARDLRNEDLILVGGAGLIIASGNTVHPTGRVQAGMMAAYDEGTIPGYKAIAEAVHSHEAKAVGQVGHGGRETTSFFSQRAVWAPSPIPCPVCREMPHEMDRLEIQEVVDGFARWFYIARDL